MHYVVRLDRTNSQKAGPDETFQVVSIDDDEDNSYTESIGLDQRIHFHSLEELAEEIERLTGEPVELDEE